MPHRRIARRLSTFNWLRWELGTVVAFHGLMSALILLAPDHFVVNRATWAVFYYLHRPGMGVAFLAATMLAAVCWWRPRPLVQLATWVLVYMLGAGWITGFVFAVHHGTGGLYGVIVWSVLLVLWASTAVRLGLGNGGTGVADRVRRGER